MTTMLTEEPDDTPDLEGCLSGSSHCHGRRSARQENAFTPDGRIRACHRPAGWGTNHPGEGKCKLHGGSSPGYIKKVERERRERALAKARQEYGTELDVDPATALLQEVRRTAGAVAFLEAKVQELESGEMVWGVVEETTNWERNADTGGVVSADSVVKRRAQENAWLKLYRDERRHLAAVSKEAIQAGATKTLVEVFRQVGETYVRLIDRVVDQLELTDDQRGRLPAVMQAELTALLSPDDTGRTEYTVTELEGDL